MNNERGCDWKCNQGRCVPGQCSAATADPEREGRDERGMAGTGIARAAMVGIYALAAYVILMGWV
jgi:hypothetical protein